MQIKIHLELAVQLKDSTNVLSLQRYSHFEDRKCMKSYTATDIDLVTRSFLLEAIIMST